MVHHRLWRERPIGTWGAVALEIIDTVMAFVGDTSISRRYTGERTLYDFLVFDPEACMTEGAAGWEGHWRACTDTADEDATGPPCQICGLRSLDLCDGFVGYIEIALHRQPTYLCDTMRVRDLILEKMRFDHREMCSQCRWLLYWSASAPYDD